MSAIFAIRRSLAQAGEVADPSTLEELEDLIRRAEMVLERLDPEVARSTWEQLPAIASGE